ncbi:MAG: YkgJ family cysteine cluster protein [Bacteroidota bacterium]|nr:YkgJ family cysteine cluster protein [Bacteroidota bacterium]
MMNKSAQDQIDAYYALRAEIDSLSQKLTVEHQKHLNCRQGCDHCCVNLRLLPVEFHAILSELTPDRIPYKAKITREEDPCTFLNNHSCIIYASRPIICRTHGLPLLFMNDEGTDLELALCERNFTDAQDMEFTVDNTYPEDKFVSRLNMINREFINHYHGSEYKGQQLIPLTRILNQESE